PRKVTLALDPHGLAGGGKNRNFSRQEFLSPRRLRPVNGHGENEIDLFLPQEREGTGVTLEMIGGTDQGGWKVRVTPRQISRPGGAGFLQNLQWAVGKRADAEGHDRQRVIGTFRFSHSDSIRQLGAGRGRVHSEDSGPHGASPTSGE